MGNTLKCPRVLLYFPDVPIQPVPLFLGKQEELEGVLYLFWSYFFNANCLWIIRALGSLTAITQLAHHGMIFVPIGYTFGSGMFEMQELKGGSPYGAGTYAGDGSRQPTKLELEQAFHQGKYISGIAKKLKNGA